MGKTQKERLKLNASTLFILSAQFFSSDSNFTISADVGNLPRVGIFVNILEILF
jgi:hypothetical protein